MEWITIGGLVGLCALFLGAALAFQQLDASHEFAPEPRVESDPSGGTANAPPTLEIPPLSTFAALIERPLFAATRRPISATVTPTVSGAGENLLLGKFKFSGVVITGNQKFVYLTAPGASETLKVQQGGMLEGWRITEITRDRIRLRSKQGEREYIFHKESR